MILLARTNPEAESKYKGLSFFLAPMKVAGVETTKIKKLTGEYGFTQTFFTDARVPADELMGGEGNGWKVAMQTLEYERGARVGQAGGYITTDLDTFAIAALAKDLERGGRSVLDDDVLADEVVDYLIEAQSLTLNGIRRRIPGLIEDRPHALPLMNKLVSSEFVREVNEFAIRLQGPLGAYYRGDENAVDARSAAEHRKFNATSSASMCSAFQRHDNHMTSLKQSLGGIGVSEEQIELRNVAAAFCREKSPVDKVRALLEDDLGHDPDVWTEVCQLGWLGIAIPEEYGGAGLSLTEVTPVIEQMGKNLMGGPFLSTTLAAQAILIGGTNAQKAAYLPAIAEGQIATTALTEANADFDLTNISATATQKGDTLELSGSKILVADAQIAELIVASVKLSGEVALVLIPKSAVPDDNLRREIVIDETRRSFEVSLDGISVPATNLMDTSQTSAALEHIELTASLLLSAEMCGGAQACIDYTVDYLNTRTQFGKKIGAYQALKHATVDAFVDYEKARSHLYSAAWCFSEQGRGEIAVRMAKAQATKAFSYAADRAIQFHGGFGFTYDCDAQLYRRRAMWCASRFGDARWHKKKLAKLLLS